MPFFIKNNNTLLNSNVFIKHENSLPEVKNIWVKEHGSSGNLRPIWNYGYRVGQWGSCSVTCGGGYKLEL